MGTNGTLFYCRFLETTRHPVFAVPITVWSDIPEMNRGIRLLSLGACS